MKRPFLPEHLMISTARSALAGCHFVSRKGIFGSSKKRAEQDCNVPDSFDSFLDLRHAEWFPPLFVGFLLAHGRHTATAWFRAGRKGTLYFFLPEAARWSIIP